MIDEDSSRKPVHELFYINEEDVDRVVDYIDDRMNETEYFVDVFEDAIEKFDGRVRDFALYRLGEIQGKAKARYYFKSQSNLSELSECISGLAGTVKEE